MPEIVVGFDDTPQAHDALAFAALLARATGAPLRVIAVVPPVAASSGAFLGAAAAPVDGVEVSFEPIAGVEVTDALHAEAQRRGAALIVVGSAHRGRAGRVLPGSTGERLLRGAPCAVAIAPRGYAACAGTGIATIGVAYDASEESSRALAAACVLARRLDATLRAIHVFDATRVGRPALMTGPAWSTMRDVHEDKQREELEQAVAELPEGVVAEPRFLVGRPGDELARQSATLDVMFVGSRGHQPLPAVVLGGVSHVLLARAACPVVILPRGARTGLDLRENPSPVGALRPDVAAAGVREMARVP